MSLLDSTAEPPHSKGLRYVISTVVFLALIALSIWWVLRFHTEKQTVKHFLERVVSGQMEQAYHIWKPTESYTFDRFLDDWGPKSEDGPIRSFRIVSAQQPKSGSTGVIVVAEVSPYQPFPESGDAAKQSKTKEVRIWVERGDQSLAFPP